MQLQVRGGKGFKDRYIPLPERTLTLLRHQWLTHHNSIWLFPAAMSVVILLLFLVTFKDRDAKEAAVNSKLASEAAR